ncbi:MAG: hypothetical protein KAU14_00665, partial [Thermoplasmata archaeon]|nr:hypothetical protein [Thermoplasmata archaeon]
STDLKIKVEPTPERAKEKKLDRLAREVSKSVRAFVGVDLEVEIVPIGSIPRSEGRIRRVIDVTGEEI